MKKLNLIILFAAIFGIAWTSCKKEAETKEETPSGHVQLGDDLSQTNPSATSSTGLGSINIEAMRDLWENCDAIDLIFYKTNFSMSQNEKAAIQNTIGFIGPGAVAHNPNCKPVARMSFQVKGEIRQEADVYIDEGCQYVLWMKDNKPVYINPISPQGAMFFQQIVTRGQDAFK
jgi:hypothetical protein